MIPNIYECNYVIGTLLSHYSPRICHFLTLLVAVFEVFTAVAVAVAVVILITAVFASVAAKPIDVWGDWRCGSVLVCFKSVDEIHFVEF
jgi:hypothetical protein